MLKDLYLFQVPQVTFHASWMFMLQNSRDFDGLRVIPWAFSNNGICCDPKPPLTHWDRVTHVCVSRVSIVLIDIRTFSFEKIHLKTQRTLSRPQCVNQWSFVKICATFSHYCAWLWPSIATCLDICRHSNGKRQVPYMYQSEFESLSWICAPREKCRHSDISWWRHQMQTFSALLAFCAGNSPVTDEFPSQRPMTRSFDVFFDLRMNKSLGKQSWGWWFETPFRSLWRHFNVVTLPFQLKTNIHLYERQNDMQLWF